MPLITDHVEMKAYGQDGMLLNLNNKESMRIKKSLVVRKLKDIVMKKNIKSRKKYEDKVE